MNPAASTEMPPRPGVAHPGPWAFPEPQVHELDNGATVLAYDLPGQYVISVRTIIPLPLSFEPRDREGVSLLTARLLDEGTSQHTSEEFAELLERNGIALGAGVNEAGMSVEVDFPKRFHQAALDLLVQALRDPDFPEQEVRRHVRTRLAEIEQERASASQRASRELIATYFADAERASRPTGGTTESVASITREDVVDFHARHLGPAGSTVVLAGDLSGIDVGALVGQTIAGWSENVTRDPVPPPRAPERADDAERIVIVDRPGSVQSEISVGWSGPDRSVARGWAAYPVLSFILGGSPNARVDAVLREEKGYTYGIRSTFRPRQRGGLFMTSGSVRADATVESVALLLDILASGRDGFSEQERDAGVDFIFRTAPGRFATADAVADEAAGLALDGLPLTFTTDNLRRTGELTADDLTAAYRQFVDGRWSVVIVGDAKLFADGVRDLGRGEVTVVPV
jgi:zinc protease